MIDPEARIHPSADIETGVTIGRGTAVWHRAHVREGARLGTECVIGGGAFIDAGVVIGDRVKIQNGALVYHGATVEDGVFIGPGAIITNDRHPRAIRPDGALATAEDWTVSTVTLRTGCSIGAGAIVIAGSDVGPFAMVGAAAVVTHDVPAYALVVGNPARLVGWVCACGTRLGDDLAGRAAEATCPACERRYRRAGDGLEPVA